MLRELKKIGQFLPEEMHLAICPFDVHRFEVIAVRNHQDWEDAFPLPLDLQNACAEAEILLENRLASRLELSELPDDFWEEKHELRITRFLKVTLLGRSAQKYLRVYRSVGEVDLHFIEDFGFSQRDLADVARWLREANLFDYLVGDQVMKVLGDAARGVNQEKGSPKSTVFYLEMTSACEHQNRSVVEGLVLKKRDDATGDFNARMYQSVGKDWHWRDRLDWETNQWNEYVSQEGQSTWTIEYEHETIGYCELRIEDGSVEIAYFGLLPAMIGKGLGGASLSLILEEAWKIQGLKRVWLHTCTEDHPHALANYQKRGFCLFKIEEKKLPSLPLSL